MQTKSRTWTLSIVAKRKSKIDPKPQYQRTEVWTKSKKQLLIDSILRGYDIPKIYIRTKSDVTSYEHEVVDGQQRLQAIWDFYEDRFPLPIESAETKYGDLSGKKYSELPSDIQDDLDLVELYFVEILEASDVEIADLFRRLQKGVPLNNTEQRNALLGNLRDFVVETCDSHSFFKSIKYSAKRFAHHELLAYFIQLEINHAPANLSSNTLDEMYTNHQNFQKIGSLAKRVKRNLDFLNRALNDSSVDIKPMTNIKWGLVDLYLLVSVLGQEHIINKREEDFAKFYFNFEKNRRMVRNPKDLIADFHDKWDELLYEYVQVFKNRSGNLNSLKKRHNVYFQFFLRDNPDLKPKDTQRLFTSEERMFLWLRSNCKCEKCDKEIVFDEMEADHRVPHSKGGQTTVENGQALCKQCNVGKGAK